MRSYRSTHNLLAVSANTKETAINTAQTLDTSMLVSIDDVINLEPRRESNAGELTGKEEPDAVYDLGNLATGSFNFLKAQPQHFAFLMAYALGAASTAAAGSGYGHTITPISGDEDDERSVPSFTAAMRFGLIVLKRRFASMFVDSFTATFAKDDWCKIVGNLKGCGLAADDITEESITAAPNDTSLTLSANAVEGADAQGRLDNVQRIRVELESGVWTEVEYSAASDATPSVISISAPAGAGSNVTYKVLYIPTESGWMTFPARVTETPLRVSEVTLKIGGAWNDLVVNGTMEADTNWNDEGTPATHERSNTQAHAGTYSRKFTPDAATEGIKSDDFESITGRHYHAKLWVYPDDTTTVSIVVRKGDDSGNIYDESHTGLDQDAWNKIVIDYTETAGGDGAYIAIHSGAETSGDWYVDDVEVLNFQGGREVGAEINSVEWSFNNNLDIEFVIGADGAYGSRAFRPARTQTISLGREFREYILQQHIDDNDTLGLYILAEGAVYDSPHKYQVEIVFPDLAVLTAPLSVGDGRVAEAGDLLVLEDDTYGSVIGHVKNLQSSYAA